MPAAVTLFSGLAVRKPLDEGVLDAFTAETGVTVETTFDPTNVLLKEISAGARPDVMIGVARQLDDLVAGGVLDGGTLRPLARTSIGLAAAPGAPVTDIADGEAFRAALLAARSVAYSRTGASGVYFADLLERLGIAEEVNARATIVEKGFTALAVVDGRADLAVQQLSELAFVPGAVVVGPLPPEYQQVTQFSVAVGSHAAENAAAAALARHLTAPAARERYLAAGLEVA